MSKGIESLIPLALAIDSTKDRLYLGVGTEYNSNGGLYVRSLTTQVGVAKPEGRFSLAQSYPNPFNSTTTIRYTIPSREHVSLKVYDVLGREIAILVNQEKQAGERTTVFDASSVSSGVYVCRIQAGEFVQTNKMMLLQ
ncbi:MAG: T9SS type A sorting domain-containing protein [Ignavibacteria bacterium]|nr:T9SS type A sorting domain-containing protein [Ignavibacteria bacterium]